VKDALASWAFGVAFVAAGLLLTLLSPRALIAVSGAGVMLVAVFCAAALRRQRLPATASAVEYPLGSGGRALRNLGGGENRPDLVGRHHPDATVLDHRD
jgi:hypothetical protein